jgi:hypothetical protein
LFPDKTLASSFYGDSAYGNRYANDVICEDRANARLMSNVNAIGDMKRMRDQKNSDKDREVIRDRVSGITGTQRNCTTQPVIMPPAVLRTADRHAFRNGVCDFAHIAGGLARYIANGKV